MLNAKRRAQAEKNAVVPVYGSAKLSMNPRAPMCTAFFIRRCSGQKLAVNSRTARTVPKNLMSSVAANLALLFRRIKTPRDLIEAQRINSVQRD
jgi:hypothetical protein